MGYQALLFCPDEKTARTVTQVLSELEFNVESCTEPFAAVKKLMGQHFDAVVVDCDNEQNATLLFKSARNSTSNQASLAVAVVEGQAGVAKAFRIGANLVLTKPINIEQAKGTLARGSRTVAQERTGQAGHCRNARLARDTGYAEIRFTRNHGARRVDNRISRHPAPSRNRNQAGMARSGGSGEFKDRRRRTKIYSTSARRFESLPCACSCAPVKKFITPSLSDR